MITYKQLVEKTMPPEKKRNAKRDIVGFYIYRPIENLISIPFIEAGINPTPVTVASLIPVLISMVVFALAKSFMGFFVGWLLILLWNILDGVDGNIARYCNKTSAKGELWDATVGWIGVIAFYEGLGFSAFRLGNHYVEPVYYVFFGVMAATLWLFPRLVMHKKAGIVGKEATKELKDLSHEGMTIKDIAKLLLFNVISINGAAAVVFLLCLIFGFTAECVLFYFVVNLVVATGSLWSLLK